MKLYGKGNYDIASRYKLLNEKCFDGKLPSDINFRWKRLQHWFGEVVTSCCADCFEMDKDTITLSLSSCYKTRKSKHMDELLLHEMIHVWGLVELKDLLTSHDDRFWRKCAEIESKFRYEVSRDEDSWKHIYTSKSRATRQIFIYEYDDGCMIWIPVHPSSIDKTYERLSERARKSGRKHCLIEVSGCLGASISPCKGWPRHDGYLITEDVRNRMFKHGQVKVIGSMGISDKEIREMILP